MKSWEILIADWLIWLVFDNAAATESPPTSDPSTQDTGKILTDLLYIAHSKQKSIISDPGPQNQS